MNHVDIRKIPEGQQLRLLSPETMELMNRVQERAYQLFEQSGGVPGHELADWLQAEKEVFRVPDMELAESEGAFQLQIALPGFEPKDIHVAALPNALILEGEAIHQHHANRETVHLCEFGERRVFREIRLPGAVDVNQVSATLDKGVLRIRVTKAEQGRGKRAAA